MADEAEPTTAAPEPAPTDAPEPAPTAAPEPAPTAVLHEMMSNVELKQCETTRISKIFFGRAAPARAG